MATTSLIPIHVGKGRSIARALGQSTDYIKNPDKTDDGEWITSYECDPLTVAEEFRFSKNQYATITGRDQGARDVIAYHLRISFKPGETDAATANKIGHDLAFKLTKGDHAFVCCTHTDKDHIHSHVVINSTSLCLTKKFRNFKGSAFAVRKIADILCLENGLSVIENPRPSRGSYGQWLGNNKSPTVRDNLRELIDKALQGSEDYDGFIEKLQALGVEIKQGKQLSFRLPGAKRFVRQDTIDDDYSYTAILERLSGKRIIIPRATKPNMLIDIQAKIQLYNSPGFERFARIYNLKEMARTLVWLQERGIDSRDLLNEKTSMATQTFNASQSRIKEIESRQKEISELQRHIGAYGKTKEAYAQYKRLKKHQPTAWEKFRKTEHPAVAYYEACRADITLHEAAKRYFDEHGFGKNKKIPAMQTLKTEYAKLDAEKCKLYAEYKPAREEMIALKTAKQNVDMFLDGTRDHLLERTKSRDIDAL